MARTKDVSYERMDYWTIKVVNALFVNNAGKHERVKLENKLHHDATNNGQLIEKSKIKGTRVLKIGMGDLWKKEGGLLT